MTSSQHLTSPTDNVADDTPGPWSWLCSSNPVDRRNERRTVAWTLTWILSWLGADFTLEEGWLEPGPWALAACAFTLVLGIMTFRAYQRQLRETDELHRKIHLDAMALALGVGVVGGMTYWLLGLAGAAEEVELLNVIVAMIVTYSIGVIFGLRRYA